MAIRKIVVLWSACTFAPAVAPQAPGQTPAGTAFTYQGRLEDAAGPANGTHDFELELFDAPSAGAQVGATLTQPGVAVSDGMFTLELDFGPAAFDGAARWLQVAVRPAGGGPFVVLAPRQELTGAPYAVRALSIPLAGTGSAATAAHSDHDHAGVYAGSTHDHLGQTWAAASGAHGLQVTNSSPAQGSALRGAHTGTGLAAYGVLGENAQSAAGAAGVLGDATHTAAINYGVFGRTASTIGRGVYGLALATAGQGVGVMGHTVSPEGTAVFGSAMSSVGTSFGVFGRAESSAGYGVYGFAAATSGATYGVLGFVTSSSGWGLYTPNRAFVGTRLGIGTTSPTVALDVQGEGRFATGSGQYALNATSSATVGTSAAVRGHHSGAGPLGAGVLGENAQNVGGAVAVVGLATGAGAPTYGVIGNSSSTVGTGVYGVAAATSGTTFGVYGTVNSPSGWGLFTPQRAHVGDSLDVVAAGQPVVQLNRTGTDGAVVNIAQDGVIEGNISISGTTVSYNAFTGSHYAWTDEPLERDRLVSLTGDNRRLHDRPGAEPIYGVAATSRANDPFVFGAYLGRLEPSRTGEAATTNPHLVAAVGNGHLWIADAGADVQIGDALVSSGLPGHAMRDDEAFEVSYVVARAAEPVRWEDVSDTLHGVKHARISVLFAPQVREKTAPLRAALQVLEARALAQDARIARLEAALRAAGSR